MAQRVMVDEILVAEREAKHTLADQGRDAVFGAQRITPIPKAGRKPINEPDRTIRGAHQQRARIRRDRAAVKPATTAVPRQVQKPLHPRYTVSASGISSTIGKSLQHNNFASFRAPMHLILMRYAG